MDERIRHRPTILAVTALSIAMWAYACGDGAVDPPPDSSGPATATPTTVAVTPATAVLTAVGNTAQLAAEVRDQNGQTMTGATVSWASGDVLVAGVSGSGLVTATGDGTVTVTATAGSASGTAAITVAQEASEVTVSPVADTLPIADTVRLSASAVDANGHAVAHPEFAWASGDHLVAVVSGEGLVTGVSAGEVEITAMLDGATGRAQLAVVVLGPPAVVVVSPAADTVRPGETVRLAAEAFDEGGFAVRDAEFSWSSSDVSVARVDPSGRVTTLASGRATVTAATGEARGASEIWVVTVAEQERLALVELYKATGGPNWANSGNWLTDAPLGHWHGVATDGSGRVSRLRLSNNRLTGPIPPELGNLASLESIGLRGNDLSGPIPPELGSLANLQRLELGENALEGSIPPELGNLANVERLELHDNNLTGPIPGLGNLVNLESLRLSDNRLTGPIPLELSGLAKLRYLELGGNALEGPIPAELGDLANLESLRLNNNLLTGPIPAELGNLANLQYLELGHEWEWTFGAPSPPSNELTGPIPPELGNLANLKSLRLSDNRLTGPIPPELGSLANLRYLELGENALEGPIPVEFGNLGNLESLIITDYYSDYFDRLEDRTMSLVGPIPPELGNLANLQRLDLGSLILGGPIPPELGSLGNLQVLHVPNNVLEGPIPPELGNLANLQHLNINHNRLTGQIPASFVNLSSLRAFYWSYSDLCAPNTAAFRAWLSGIENHFGGPFCGGGGGN